MKLIYLERSLHVHARCRVTYNYAAVSVCSLFDCCFFCIATENARGWREKRREETVDHDQLPWRAMKGIAINRQPPHICIELASALPVLAPVVEARTL